MLNQNVNNFKPNNFLNINSYHHKNSHINRTEDICVRAFVHVCVGGGGGGVQDLVSPAPNLTHMAILF